MDYGEEVVMMDCENSKLGDIDKLKSRHDLRKLFRLDELKERSCEIESIASEIKGQTWRRKFGDGGLAYYDEP